MNGIPRGQRWRDRERDKEREITNQPDRKGKKKKDRSIINYRLTLPVISRAGSRR